MTICAIGTMYYQRRARAIEAAREVMGLGATVEFHPDAMPFLTGSMSDYFRDVSKIEFSQESISDHDLAKLKDLPKLQSLSVSSSRLRKEGFEHISKCGQLKELFISGCGRFDDSCAESIRELAKLNTLDVSDTNLTSTGADELASIESLRHFIFSSTGRSQVSLRTTPAWCGVDELRSITGHPDLQVTMVGEAYLDNLDDKAIVYLKKMDTQRLREFHVRNSALSIIGVNAICNMAPDLRRIRFRNCPLQPDDLRDFDVGSANLMLEGTTLKVDDLIDLFGKHFVSVKLGSSGTEFSTPLPQYKLSIDELADQLDVDCFLQMPKLQHVDCFCRDNESFLKAVEHAQPSISIYAHLTAEDANATFWDAIKATPSLTGLAVHEPPKGICPQFTTEHQLRSLHLYEVPDDPSVISEKFFREVAKLKSLGWFTMRNKFKVGKEISPLTTLPKLNRVDVGILDDDAASLLLDMSLLDLGMSWDHLSPETIKRIRARHTR